MSDVRKALEAPFPKAVLKQRRKGGKTFTYAPQIEYVVRLNDALGHGNWGTQILRAERDPLKPGWVLAHVRLQAKVDGTMSTYEAFGGQEIKNLSGTDDPVDLGDEFKGAVSDAFKKACQQLGIGLELARSEEALAADEQKEQAAEHAEKEQARQEAVAELREVVMGLPDEIGDQVKAWFKEQGFPKLDFLTEDQVVKVAEHLEKVAG